MAESKLRFILCDHDGTKVTLKRGVLLFTVAAVAVLIFGIIIYCIITANFAVANCH